MADIPTVAEVRRDLTDGLSLARHEGTLFADIADRMEATLTRLDPDTQVIVTGESLAEALHTFICSGGWCSCEADATALMRALTLASEGGRGSKRGEK